VAFFDDRDEERIPPGQRTKLAGRLDAVGDFVRANNIDQIFIALPIAAQPRILNMINDLHNTTASIWFVADLARFQPVQPSISTISGYPVVAICESPFRGMPGTIKRAMDVIISTIAIVLLAPVMLGCALAIKLTSPGPVIFKQRRYGLDGGEITVYKFRSMTVTEDGDNSYTQVSRGDARVTPVGAFLRKTSLDEVPQFFNVFQGRMSVVGPRPHAVAVNENYRGAIPSYMIRHMVRPGITGWAQVHGYRGGDDLESMTKRIEHDLYYMRNWSLWLDLQILVRTVLVIFKDPTAY
jgi:putative colanic acid biosynthesis UDP-glucose lipid carrier transferase